MNGYLVLAVCNFDDVVVLITANKKAALGRAKQIAERPELRFKANSLQPNDTAFLWARVFRFERGRVVKLVAEYERGGARANMEF
jgi:hypothetical protein